MSSVGVILSLGVSAVIGIIIFQVTQEVIDCNAGRFGIAEGLVVTALPVIVAVLVLLGLVSSIGVRDA